MANTLREFTASRGGESHSDAAGSIPIPAMGLHPHISTPVAAICQGINDLTLPVCRGMISRIASAVDIAFAMHNRSNGSTVSLMDGSMTDKKLYAVSIYPERTIELWEKPTRQDLFDFIQANVELLLKPRHASGTWFDDFKQVHVLDVVLLVHDRDAALSLALHSGQVAIFDLDSRREIPVSSPSEILLSDHAGGVNA